MRVRTIGTALVLVMAVSGIVTFTVAQTTQKPAFAVASVKRNDSGSQTVSFLPSTGRFNAQNATLGMLINWAYKVQDFQVIGAPGWINSEGYDVDARTDGTASGQDINGPMLQLLLEERFKLVVHRETKELPVYLLTPAKNGLKLSEGKCLTLEPNSRPDPGQRQSDFCGYMVIGNNNLRATSIRMENLVDALKNILRRTVIDKTGFSGNFDVTIRWRDESAPANTAPPSTDALPSIFTAFEEQLGLKLESSKGPVEVLVIDSVQKPSEN
jgi:uncharacterized protein (TIGR03435 family)